MTPRSPTLRFEALEATDPGLRRLVASHLAFAAENTPPGFAFALDVEALLEDGSRFFGARDGDEVVGIAALKPLEDGHVELKSMHTSAAARRRGIGRFLLAELLATCTREGLRRISLETGVTESFVAARALYASFGFRECELLPQYAGSEHSVCMTLELEPDAAS